MDGPLAFDIDPPLDPPLDTDRAPHLAPGLLPARQAPIEPEPVRGSRLLKPRRVLATRAALGFEHGRAMLERAAALGCEVVELPSDRLPPIRAENARRAYVEAKGTLAVTVASPAKRRLQPIPPSADWRFDVAEGCPAHCQYCYLAGSLSGAPITRAYANLDEILGGLSAYAGQGTITSKQAARAGEGTTFEASCYTDPLGIEHLTGSLAEAIRHFGAWDAPVQLRATTKFDTVDPLLGLDHRGRTRLRLSVNAEPVARRFEGGTSPVAARLDAMGRLARAGYPVGLTVAPIMPIEGWRESYGALLDGAAAALAGVERPDLTVELITHRFTPGSKQVLLGWYPGTGLEMDEERRARKTTKFGSLKFVYRPEAMREMRTFFEAEVPARLPGARILYWT